MSARFSTDQGTWLKAIFESVRDFIGEGQFFFREDGLELLGQDKARVVLVRYSLPKQRITASGGSYAFESAEPISVGIKTKVFATVLKCANPGDTVCLEISPAVPGRLIFTCRNGAKQSRWEIVTPQVLEEDEVDPGAVDSLEYSGSVTMPSVLFHEMMRDLSTADSPTIRLNCDGSKLALSAEGLMARVRFEIADVKQQHELPKLSSVGHRRRKGDKRKKAPPAKRKREDEEEEEEEESEEEDEEAEESGEETAVTAKEGRTQFASRKEARWPVDETYPTVFLQRVAKAKNICSRISVHMRSDYPAAFVYDSPIGTLTYLIAPRNDDDLLSTAAATALTGKKEKEGEEDDD